MLFLVGPMTASAVSFYTNGRFIRIYSTDNIDDKGYYLLMATSQGVGYLLSDELVSKGKKLNTVATKSIGETLSIPSPKFLWKFRPTASGSFQLISADNGKALQLSGTTDVGFATPSSSSALLFSVTLSDSLFRFAINGSDRSLLFNDGYSYSGFYKGGAGYLDYRIYKYVCDTTSLSDANEIPQDSFAICHAEQAIEWSANGYSQHNISDYVLSDGTIAADVNASVLHFQETGTSTSLIDRQGHDFSDVLKSLLKEKDWSKGASWKYRDSYAVLLLLSDSSSYAFASPQGSDSIQIMPIADINGLSHQMVPLRRISSAPVEYTNLQGLKSLTGGWSRPRLLRLSVTGPLSGLDLTGTVLPNHLPTIDIAPSPNMVIYISKGDSSKLSNEQTNVVACSDEGNLLIRPLILKDKHPYYFDRTFNITKGMMSYSRKIYDNQWQTLMLPFSVNRPLSRLTIETYFARQNDKLLFRRRADVPAYSPVIFRCSDLQDSLEVTFPADEQTIEATLDTLGVFNGTTKELTISGSDNIYVLNAVGKAFTSALSGSFLHPFRCFFIIKSGVYDSNEITSDYVNDIRSITNSVGQQPDVIYDLSGRRMDFRHSGVAGFHGLYIIDHKLYKN